MEAELALRLERGKRKGNHSISFFTIKLNLYLKDKMKIRQTENEIQNKRNYFVPEHGCFLIRTFPIS